MAPLTERSVLLGSKQSNQSLIRHSSQQTGRKGLEWRHGYTVSNNLNFTVTNIIILLQTEVSVNSHDNSKMFPLVVKLAEEILKKGSLEEKKILDTAVPIFQT